MEPDGTTKGSDVARPRGTREDDDPRYRRAHEAYVRLLREGRLRCGEQCPLYAVGHCTTRCW